MVGQPPFNTSVPLVPLSNEQASTLLSGAPRRATSALVRWGVPPTARQSGVPGQRTGLTELLNGSVCDLADGRRAFVVTDLHGSLWAQFGTTTPYAVGFQEVGWHQVLEVALPEVPQQRGGFAALFLGPLRPLPAYLEFSSYDAGHEVMLIRGTNMGATGVIRSVAPGNTYRCVWPRPGTPDGPQADLHPIPPSTLGVLRKSGVDDEELLPMQVRLPVDSRVWLRLPDRVVAGLIAEYLDTDVLIWVPAEQVLMNATRSRTHIVERVADQPCPLEVPVPKRLKVPASRRRPRAAKLADTLFGDVQVPDLPLTHAEEESVRLQLAQVEQYIQQY